MKTFDPIRFHQCPVVPQVADTDYGGGVYHGKYFALYNQARDVFLADLGVSYKWLMDRGGILTVAEVNCRYRRPVTYGDPLFVNSHVSWYRNKSFGIYQQMIVKADPDDIVKNEMDINLVCTRKGKGAVALPEVLTRAIDAYYDRSAPGFSK